MAEGFPNLFAITGPGSPSVISNMIVSIEQHVEWISDCLDHLRREGVTEIEPEQEAEDEWVAHVDEVANATLFPQADSWYVGANIDGKARGFMPYVGGVGVYREVCDDIAEAGYPGFHLTTHPQMTAYERDAGKGR
jgi:cyclohexanone monooxygenase